MENRRFIGFNSQPTTLKMINDKVDHLLARTPSDSNEKTQFEKRGDMFLGQIRFRSSHGEFSARGLGKNLNRMVENITRSIDKQIRKWRSFRETYIDNPSSKQPDLPKTQNLKKKSILIIDDDHDSVRLLEQGLKSLGCKVHYVSDGLKASKELAETYFDLIVLDWMMPGLNGGETLEKAENLIASDGLIGERKLQREIPVVICSAKNLEHLGNLPDSEYFNYIDFWQKPVSYKNIVANATQILTTI